MTIATPDITAALRRLAEAEETCPAYRSPNLISDVTGQSVSTTHGADCEGGCRDTGYVPCFRDASGKALFRKACYGTAGSSTNIHEICGCHGLGWLPLDVSEMHLETVLLVLGEVAFREYYDKWVVTDLPDADGYFETLGVGKTPLEAALLALDAVLVARKEAKGA